MPPEEKAAGGEQTSRLWLKRAHKKRPARLPETPYLFLVVVDDR